MSTRPRELIDIYEGFFLSFENDDSSYWFEAKQSTMNIPSHLNIPNNLDPINLSKADWFK